MCGFRSNRYFFSALPGRAAMFAVMIVMASASWAQTNSITQPLSPTSLNVFNFGPHSFKVQYPAGTSFSGIEMTVAAEQISQPAFSQRVAGSQFSRAVCDVYLGEAGNCILYRVTCQPSLCPSLKTQYITVETSFNSGQSIVNPGFLTTPIHENSWTNILYDFYFMRIDPTARGHTKGFSEFIAVGLGATNPEGLGNFAFDAPLRSQDPKSFPVGTAIPVNFSLTSVAHPGQPVIDAMAGVSVLMVADGKGHPVSVPVYSIQNAFQYSAGTYKFTLPSQTFAPGSYILSVYGNAFASQATSFTMH